MSEPPQEEPRRHGLPMHAQNLQGSNSEAGAAAACGLGCLVIAILFFAAIVFVTVMMF